MPSIDWGLIKLQYEMFGESLSTLAEEYSIAPGVLKYAAEERGWQICQIAPATQEYDPNTSKADLTEAITENHTLLRSLKQSTLNPRYITLESALLGKCIAFLNNLQADDITNAPALKVISDIYKSLTETNHPNPASNQSEQQNQGTKVVIMNQVAIKDDDNSEPVTVTVGAALSSVDSQGAERPAPEHEAKSVCVMPASITEESVLTSPVPLEG